MTIELESFLQHNSVKCSNCKYKFEFSIEVVLEFEQEDKWNGLLISTSPLLSVKSVSMINEYL